MAKMTRYNYEAFDVLCEAERISANKVCIETGIASATIYNWKLGKYTPKDDKIQKIANYFHVEIDFFKNFETRDRLLAYYKQLKNHQSTNNDIINIPHNFGSNIILDKISQDPIFVERVMMLYAMPEDRRNFIFETIESFYGNYIKKKEAVSNE